MAVEYKVRRESFMYLDPLTLYGGMKTFCCLKIFHGGKFGYFPGRRYVGGEVNIVDMVQVEHLTLSCIQDIIVHVGRGKYCSGEAFKCYYKKPCEGLDMGICRIFSNNDVQVMVMDAQEDKCVTIYTEIGASDENECLEPLVDITVASPRLFESDGVSNSPPLVRRRGDRSIFMAMSRRRLGFNKEEDLAQWQVNLTNLRFQESCLFYMNMTDPIPDISTCDSAEDSDYICTPTGDGDEEEDFQSFKRIIDPEAEWCGEGLTGKQVVVADNLSSDDDIFSDGSLNSDDDDELQNVMRRKRVRPPKPVSPGSGANVPVFFLGQEWSSKKLIKEAIMQHSIDTRRALKIVKNDKRRIRATCSGTVAGECEEDENMERLPANMREARSVQKKSCPWVLLASMVDGSTTWQVKTLRQEHWCLQSRNITACTFKYLAKGITDKVRSNPDVPIGALRHELEQKFEVQISAMKVFRAKQEAHKLLIGSYKEQYAKLWDYCAEFRRAMPSTSIHVQVEPCSSLTMPIRVFRRLYCCPGPLKEGFLAGCRKIICLDGTFIKGPYPGQLLSAVGIDSNNGIYPLAYAVVESENMRSWEWFLTYLGDDLRIYSNSNFCFMSDRQKGIIPAIEKLFPVAEHRFCLKHIWENLKLTFKGVAYREHLWKAACATEKKSFEDAMKELKTLDTEAWKWLASISPHHWSKSHFTGTAKTDLIYNNVCESFNSKIIDARDMPIVSFLERVREYLTKRLANVELQIRKCKTALCPNVQALMEKTKKQATTMGCIWNRGLLFQVRAPYGDQAVVDLGNKTCACRAWDVTGIPCKHAVRAIWCHSEKGGEGDPDKWVDDCYTLETWKRIYSHKLTPLNGPERWFHIEGLTTILPPPHHNQPGRPKKARRKTKEEISSQNSQNRASSSTTHTRGNSSSTSTPVGNGGQLQRSGGTVTCKKCGNKGHNQRTCTGQVLRRVKPRR